MVTVGERVDVRVTGNQPRGRNFMADPQRQRVSPAGREREVLCPDAVLETARSVERVGTGRQPNAHGPVAGVNDAWTDGEWRVGSGGGRLRAMGSWLVVGGGCLR